MDIVEFVAVDREIGEIVTGDGGRGGECYTGTGSRYSSPLKP